MSDACLSAKSGTYPSKADAKVALRKVRALSARLYPGRRMPHRVYVCPFCGDWHLTSKPKRRIGVYR